MTPSDWIATIGGAQVIILFFWGIALRYMSQTRDEARKQNGRLISMETWRDEHEKYALQVMQRFDSTLDKQDVLLRRLEVALGRVISSQ